MAAADVVDLDFADEAVAEEGRYTGSVADLDFLAMDPTHLAKVASEEVVEVLHAVVVDLTSAYSEDAVGFPLVKAARVVVLVEPVFVVVDLWLQRVALLQRHQKVWIGIRQCWISDVLSVRTLVSSPKGFQLTSQASLQCARYG
jgi:hypothetical protein